MKCGTKRRRDIARRQFRTSRPFTLIELLTVAAIMVILLGVTALPVSRMMGASGVDGAARMVSAELRRARHYAIARRVRVAVIFPDGGWTGMNGSTDADDLDQRHVAFRSAVVEYDGTEGAWEVTEWVPGSRWEFVPVSSIICDSSDTTSTLSNGLNVVVDDGSNSDAPAVVFRPSGGLVNSSAPVLRLIEGLYDIPTTSAQVRNASNYIQITVNPFTGRPTFAYP